MADQVKVFANGLWGAIDTPSGHLVLLAGLLVFGHCVGNKDLVSAGLNGLMLAMNLRNKP